MINLEKKKEKIRHSVNSRLLWEYWCAMVTSLLLLPHFDMLCERAEKINREKNNIPEFSNYEKLSRAIDLNAYTTIPGRQNQRRKETKRMA